MEKMKILNFKFVDNPSNINEYKKMTICRANFEKWKIAFYECILIDHYKLFIKRP